MLIILIDRWQVLSYLIRAPLLNQANQAMVYGYSCSLFFPGFWKWMPPKKTTKVCPSSCTTPRPKTTKSFCKEWASKLAESDKGSYYNQQKWLKDDKAPERPMETTAESISERSQLFRPRGSQARVTRGPCHIKIGRSTVLKVYCSGKEASRKTPGSGLLLICTGKCWTFKKCIE